MQTKRYGTMLCASLVLATPFAAAKVQKTRVNRPVSAISTDILLPIIRAEDERRWDNSLTLLMADKDARVRKDIEEGYRLNVTSTPTYFIDGTEISWIEDKVMEDFLRTLFPKTKTIDYGR